MTAVPVLQAIDKLPEKAVFEKNTLDLTAQRSIYGSIDVSNQKPCSMEGVVTRNVDEYSVDDFQKNVFKYVRKNHIKTDEHWTKNWKRAPLKNERK